jgi:hypothetical protein
MQSARALISVLVLSLVFSAAAYSQTGQVRVNVTQNDRTTGGTLLVNVETRVAGITPSTLGSATIDLDYDDAHLTFVNITASGINPSGDGYGVSANALTGDPVGGSGSGAYVRLSITGINVGTEFGEMTGFDVPATYVNLGTYQFTITAAGVAAGTTSLFVRTGSLSIGYFENQSNDPETGVINEAVIDVIEDANGISLPVELAEFGASIDEREVVLTWTTLSEVNNAGFDVEYTTAVAAGETDEIDESWASLGFVPGKGTTADEQTYEFRAAELEVGTYRFRLKQMDLSGAAAFSDEVEVTIVPADFLLADSYPNPFNPSATITYELPRQVEVRLQVFNVLGQHVATLVDSKMEAGRHRATFEASELASGLYFFRMEAGPFAETKSMILAK